MAPVLRRALLLAVLVTATPAVVPAQTVCDRLLPIGIVPPDGGFKIGCATRYVLYPAGGVTTVRGSYVWLAYPPCTNGPCVGLTDALLFVCATRDGYSCCISVADSIPRPPGIYAGPFKQGLAERFASDTDTLRNICFSAYAGNGARLVNVPLIHPPDDVSAPVQIVAFARMFLVLPASGSGILQVEFVAEPTPARGRSWGRTKIRYR